MCSWGEGIRVVTYNVLSPTLCSWQRFPHCQWEDLQELTRWKRVAATCLGPEIEQKSKGNDSL